LICFLQVIFLDYFYDQAIPIAANISDLTLAALNPAEKIALKFLLKKILDHKNNQGK